MPFSDRLESLIPTLLLVSLLLLPPPTLRELAPLASSRWLDIKGLLHDV